MIHSALFATESNQRYRTDLFDLLSGEEGHTQLDRPLVAQFCSNNKDTFLKAASIIAESGQVDAVDLNLVREGLKGETAIKCSILTLTIRDVRKASRKEATMELS